MRLVERHIVKDNRFEDICLKSGLLYNYVLYLVRQGIFNKEYLKVKDRYPEWTVGIDVKTEERYQCDDLLWECIKDHKTQENWKPSLSTASLWKVVVEGHEGTENDPIPYTPPMEIFNGKYYIQNGVKYRCTRNSEQPLTHDLSALVGLYVEKV